MIEEIRADIARYRAVWALRGTKEITTPQTLFDRLEAIRRSNEPKLVRKLSGFWGKSSLITQREIEEAIATGVVPASFRSEFRQAYSEFVANDIAPAWGLAFNAGSRAVFTTVDQLNQAASIEDLRIPLKTALDQWVSDRGAGMIQSITESQFKAISVILRRHIVQDPLAPRELGILLRSVIGLDDRQAGALSRIRQQAVANGLSGENLTRLVERSRSKMIRHRALRIARTELATAYNQGTRDTVRGAFEGDPQTLSGVQMIWQTSEDERVCPVCGPLNGIVVGFSSSFAVQLNQTTTVNQQTPPAHPMCRCTLLYTFPETFADLTPPPTQQQQEEDRGPDQGEDDPRNAPWVPSEREPRNDFERAGNYRLTRTPTLNRLNKRLSEESDILSRISNDLRIEAPISDEAARKLTLAKADKIRKGILEDLKKTGGDEKTMFKSINFLGNYAPTRQAEFKKAADEIGTLVNPVLFDKAGVDELRVAPLDRQNVWGYMSQFDDDFVVIKINQTRRRNKQFRVETIWHEIGHKIENSSTGISGASKQLLKKHAVDPSNTRVRPLGDGGSRFWGYSTSKGIPSNLPSAYSSKIYDTYDQSRFFPDPPTEVFSTGMQAFANRERFLEYMQTEAGRDQIYFVMGVLRGRY